MEITIDKNNATIHIKNEEILKKFLNFVNELENTKNEEYSVEFFDPTDFKKIKNCHSITTIIFSNDIKEPLDMSNHVNLKKILYLRNIDLIKLPDNLEEIEFFIRFNSPLSNLPSNLKKIRFPRQSEFLQPLNNLPIGLEELILGNNYSQPLDYLPENLKILRIGNFKNINVNNLPVGLEELELHRIEFEQINNLPTNLKILKINSFLEEYTNLKYSNDQIYEIKFPSKLEKIYVSTFYFLEKGIIKNTTNIQELHITNARHCCEYTFGLHVKIQYIKNNKNIFNKLKNIFIHLILNKKDDLFVKNEIIKSLKNINNDYEKIITEHDKYIVIKI